MLNKFVMVPTGDIKAACCVFDESLHIIIYVKVSEVTNIIGIKSWRKKNVNKECYLSMEEKMLKKECYLSMKLYDDDF